MDGLMDGYRFITFLAATRSTLGYLQGDRRYEFIYNR